jgi:hypothetical protein
MRLSVIRSCGLAAALVAASLSTGHASAVAVPRDYDDALASVRTPGFAGAWLDGGRVVVALTHPTAAAGVSARDEVARVLRRPDLATKQVVVRPARYSFRQLKSWYDAIYPNVVSVPGAVSGDVDERANVLTFGVTDVAAATAPMAALAHRLGVPSDAVTLAAQQVRKTSLDDPVRPLAGGAGIFSFGDCTLGFMARWNGVAGFMTNSHCTANQFGSDGTPLWQGLKIVPSPVLAPVGTEAFDPSPTTCGTLCRNSDAAFIGLLPTETYAPGFILKADAGVPNWNGVDKYRITAEQTAPMVGDVMTKVGRTTGLTSGAVTSTCVDATPNIALVDGAIGATGGASHNDSPVTLRCQTFADYRDAPGDSGSPIFLVTSGTDVTLAGINWGGRSAAGGGLTGVFSPIAGLEADFGALDTCAPGFTC